MLSLARMVRMAVILVALIIGFTGARSALAHADYVSSDPPADGTVTTAPERIVMVFS